MNHLLKQLFPLLFLISVAGCRDKYTPQPWAQPPPDYSENYKYYPIKDGREWTYETTIVDSINRTTTVFQELGRYNEAQQRTDFYRDTLLWSYSYWTNSGNRLGCCIDMVLLDYYQLGCTSDSVLIYKKDNGTYNVTIHQFCGKMFATEAPNFKTVKCVKTVQINEYISGNSLEITQYFGYEVGLIFRRQRSFDKFGKLKTEETQRLISKNF